MDSLSTRFQHLLIIDPIILQTSQPSWPYLPVELIQRILEEAWTSPLTGEEVTSMHTSLPLVSKTFLAIYNRLAFRDVHVATEDYSDRFQPPLSSRTPEKEAYYEAHPLLSIPSPTTINSLCRSITFHIPGLGGYPGKDPIQLYSENHPMGQALSGTLYQLKRLPWLPSLRHITIEYTNWGYNDIFDQDRLLDLPLRVSTLELRYLFTANIGKRSIRGLSNRYFGRQRWRSGHYSLPGVRELIVSGDCLDIVVDVAHMCPTLKVLEVDELKGISVLAPLPPSVHTLVLRGGRGFILNDDSLQEMQLERALKNKLFGSSEHPRIILESASVDPTVFNYTVNLCQNHDIELIYRSLYV